MSTLLQLENYKRIAALAAEHTALELLEAEDRIASLEADNRAYRELAVAALEVVTQQTKRNRQLADRIDELTRQLRELFAAPCLACVRAGRAERAA